MFDWMKFVKIDALWIAEFFLIVRCNGQNELNIECGNSCSESCAAQGKNIACPRMCTQGCFCKPGFARDTSGRCIAKNLCQNSSGNNPCASVRCAAGQICRNGINGPQCDSAPIAIPEPEPGFSRKGWIYRCQQSDFIFILTCFHIFNIKHGNYSSAVGYTYVQAFA